MRRFIVALLSATAVFATAAHAADILPTKAPPAPVVPLPYDWTGAYVGVNVGYGWSTNSSPDFAYADGSPYHFGPYFNGVGNVIPDVNEQGAVFGGQFGYNWMFAGTVLGVVADFQGTGMKQSDTVTIASPGAFPATIDNQVEVRWFGTVRANAGIALNNWMPYITGGFAYGGIQSSGRFAGNGAAFYGSNNEIGTGWTAGAGLNYGISPNWFAGIEYLYVDLGNSSYRETNDANPASWLNVTNRTKFSVVRASVNLKF